MLFYKYIWIVCLLIVGIAQGQPYYFRHYQVENGLSNNAVICSLQDKKGFMWFGTKDGLNRFDGYTFKVFRTNAEDTGSIGNNFIQSLYQDKNGTLWVGTENGIYQYNETTESFTYLNKGAAGQIRAMTMDASGNLWFINELTLKKYHVKNKTVEIFLPFRYFEATSVTTTPNGNLWVSTADGHLKKYNPAGNTFETYAVFQTEPLSGIKWIEKIYSTSKGDILVGTSTGGAKLFSTTLKVCRTILPYNYQNTDVFIRNFLQSSLTEYWIATESGIYIYNTEKNTITNLQKKYNDPYSISDNAVYTFCKDNEGGIWAGTYFGGINYYPKQYNTFEKYFPKTGENSISGNVVREIKQDNSGNLWIGTEDAGLNKFDLKTGKFLHYKPTGGSGSIAYSNIHGLLVNGNELWIGTFEHGLDIMNIATGKIIRHYTAGSKGLNSNFIYSIVKTDQAEIILCTPRGAYIYNKSTDNFHLINGLPPNIWYTTILKEANGNIWAGTYGYGVLFYNAATKKTTSLRENNTLNTALKSNRINAIFKDSKQQLWFATENGLSLLNHTQDGFKHYTTKNGLPSNFILSLLEDDANNLWVSTSKGLVRLSAGDESLSVYTTSNGILNDQFNFNAAYKAPDGTMYFGSVKGLISFHPSQIQKNIFAPPIYLTNFQIFNQDITIADKGSPLKKSILHTDKIVLDADQSTISIGFAALSYTAPEMTEYAYKLEGLDNNWTYLKKNRKAYFTQLQPGSYTFKLKATNSSGIWQSQETQLKINILPPWWASTWAYFIYTLIIIAIVMYVKHTIQKRIELKNRRRMELLETRKEKEIYEAKIEFFTNVAHEIRTPLTLIKGPLEKVMKKAALIPEIQNSLKMIDRNTLRLVNLTNQLLDFRQTEIKGYQLNFVHVNITQLLDDIYQNFKPLADAKNLTYTLHMPAEHLYAFVDVEALTKILTNLIGNAIKYADAVAEISLLALNEKEFTIEFKNDGYLIPLEMGEKIFEPFFRLKESEIEKGTGIGLALSRSLVELHKGSLQLKPTQHHMNVFSCTIPIHQENEFQLQYKGSKKATLTNTTAAE